MSASDVLRGKHLRIWETEWSPFAIVDPNSTHGWRGLDVDLLDQLSWLLGFTYELQDMGSPGDAQGGQTWTSLMYDLQFGADMFASFWVPSVERHNTFSIIKGHLDLSGVMVSKNRAESAITTNTFFAFAAPFDIWLWVAIFAVVLGSGMVDYFLEREYDPTATITASLFEYCAGALWGGFCEPRTRTSAIYQIVVAFILLVVTASYTANLAAFFTARALPTLVASSMQDIEGRGGTLCMDSNGACMCSTGLKPFHPHTVHVASADLVFLRSCAAMNRFRTIPCPVPARGFQYDRQPI